jgi:lysophospholipase L1-like esterase
MRLIIEGDSITSAGRNYEDKHDLGLGYASMIQNELKDVKVINLGVSGNRSFELLDRFHDTLNLKPDIITILIGVNDVWHSKAGKKAPTTPKDYHDNMIKILDLIKEKTPNVKVFLLEPFILEIGHVKEDWIPDLREIQGMVKDLSHQYNHVFIPLQDTFNKKSSEDGMRMEDYLKDGVHPTPLGHKLISDTLLSVLKKYI